MAEMKKQREQAEAERQAEQERLAATMRKEQAALKAAEAQRQAAAARENAVLIQQWSQAITAKIESLWRKPESASKGESCEVYVKQTTGGYIQDVRVQQCTGDEDFRRSVEAAVRLASPLPPPPRPEIFDDELLFTFTPEG